MTTLLRLLAALVLLAGVAGMIFAAGSKSGHFFTIWFGASSIGAALAAEIERREGGVA